MTGNSHQGKGLRAFFLLCHWYKSTLVQTDTPSQKSKDLRSVAFEPYGEAAAESLGPFMTGKVNKQTSYSGTNSTRGTTLPAACTGFVSVLRIRSRRS